MAIVVSLDQTEPLQVRGDKYVISGVVTVDTSSYTTGGLAALADSAANCLANFRLNSIDRIAFSDGGSIVDTRAFHVKSTGLIKLFKNVSGSAEIEHAASAMTAASYPFIAFGRLAA